MENIMYETNLWKSANLGLAESFSAGQLAPVLFIKLASATEFWDTADAFKEIRARWGID